MSEDKNGRDYEVGYCKPPVATRFPPGKSGNPNGSRARKRKPAKQMLAASLKEALFKKQRVMINGKRRYMTRMDILAEGLVINAMNGDLDARRDILRQVQIIDKQTLLEPDEPMSRRVVVSLNIGDKIIKENVVEYNADEIAAERANASRYRSS